MTRTIDGDHLMNGWEWFSSPLTPNIEFTVAMVTPVMAAELIKSVPGEGDPISQRQLSDRNVERFVTDMAAGSWNFDGAPIRFDMDGYLVDGMHRLTSVIESETPQVFLIVRGLARGIIFTIDQGAKRSFANNLHIRRIPNSQRVATATSRMWHWLHFNYGQPRVPRIVNAPFSNSSPSVASLEITLAAWPELIQATKRANVLKQELPQVPESILAFGWVTLGIIDPDLREKFFHEISGNPAQLGPEYAPKVFHRAATVGQQRIRDNRLLRWFYLPYLFRTWNAWRAGETLSHLTLRPPIGPRSLPYPEGLPEDLPKSLADREVWEKGR